MAASAPIDLAGAFSAESLQNVANINASGSSSLMVDLAPYISGYIRLNNSTGVTNTALQVKAFTSSDSNASNFNNYTTSSNFGTFTNIGTSAGTQTLNVDLRNIANSNNRYLGLSYVISGTGSNVAVDATWVGQKKASS